MPESNVDALPTPPRRRPRPSDRTGTRREQHVRRVTPAWAGLVLAAAVAFVPAAADAADRTTDAPVYLDDMDGERGALRLVEAGSLVRLSGQTIRRDIGVDGSSVEQVLLQCPPGRSAQLAYRLPPTPVTDALRLTAVVQCSRPGLRLAALATLPRSVDPTTGRPFELLVATPHTADGERWQQITLSQLPAELARMARVANAQHNVEVDIREAVVTQLVFVTPGGIGTTELLVDRIELDGPLPVRRAQGHASLAGLEVPGRFPPRPTNESQLGPAPDVPRILQWQGEPFALVKRLGFDAVLLSKPATIEERQMARQAGLWIVCPSPLGGELAEPAGVAGKSQDHQGDWSPILAWDLGGCSDQHELQQAEQQLTCLDCNAALPARPSVAWSAGDPRGVSRLADIVVLERPQAGAGLTPAEAAARLNRQQRFARPGTQFWVAIDTHLPVEQVAQLATLENSRGRIVAPSLYDLTHWTSAAMAAQPRGLVFLSEASLAGDDPQTRRRVLALELTNLRMELLEPWLASSKPAGAARSSRPGLSALVFKTERSHLLTPLATTILDPPTTESPIAFLSAGASESVEAYLLTLAGAERLRADRVTGGVRITTERLPAEALILLTQDGVAFSRVERRLRQHAVRAAALYQELLALELKAAAEAIPQLAVALRQTVRSDEAYQRAILLRREADSRQAAGDLAGASMRAEQGLAELDVAVRRLGAALLEEAPAGAWPLEATWSTLPMLAHVTRQVSLPSPQATPFPGGQFESLDELLQYGWQHWKLPTPRVATAVRLSATAPRDGMRCLLLEARADRANDRPTITTTPPVWVTSPPISSPQRRLVEVTGWVRAADPLIGQPGELKIFDSVGGEASAVRVRHAPTWQPFRLVRAVPAGTPLRLTFALSGLGAVEVDTLAYRELPLSEPAKLAGQAEGKR